MTEREVIDFLHGHLESQFPKKCSGCGRTFASLRDYLENTAHVGRPFSYDEQSGDWKPKAPIGTMSLANCVCGTTLSLGSAGIGLWQLWRLMSWARKETARRGIGFDELMEVLRTKVDALVLADG